MVHHYEYSTYNSHQKVLVNLQASNMDAVKSKNCVPFSQISVFVFVARRYRKSSSFSAFIYFRLLPLLYNGNNIVVCQVVSFDITTNKFNYRQYRKLTRHFCHRCLPKQRRSFNAMTMINDV